MFGAINAMNSPIPVGTKTQTGGAGAKKATRRGRKPSTKPGASHLSALTLAHGKGDLKAAKTHALNYAKAAHQAMMGTGGTATVEPDADDISGEPGDGPAPQDTQTMAAQSPAVAPGNNPSLARQAVMARFAKGIKK